MKTPASERILMRIDDLQASLGDVMTRVNRLEEAVRTMVDDAQVLGDSIRLGGSIIQDLTKRVEALERSDG